MFSIERYPHGIFAAGGAIVRTQEKKKLCEVPTNMQNNKSTNKNKNQTFKTTFAQELVVEQLHSDDNTEGEHITGSMNSNQSF